MLIRNMTEKDYNDVYALWASCKGLKINNVDDSKDKIKLFLKRNPEPCFVAQYDNKIVGSILVGSDGRRAYIYHMAVESSYRNKGIGTQLVNASFKSLEKIGISKAALVVYTDNEKGNAFWQKNSFNIRNDLLYRDKNLSNC